MTPRIDGQCLICKRAKNTKIDLLGFGNGPNYDCEICGYYCATVEFYRDVMLDEDLRAELSAATRKASEKNRHKPVLLTKQNYQSVAAAHRSSVASKIDQLLHLLGDRCRYPGAAVRLNPDVDYPLIEARSPAEMSAYLVHLSTAGLISRQALADANLQCGLTIPGWERIEPARRVGGEPGTCFVAMWFDSKMNDVYEAGFLPAIQVDCGYRPLRIDRTEHNNQITDEIMAGIRSAEFMVADFTGRRAGVYYEAGFARGLGREVIYCCREDSFNEVHFDNSVINHVVWADPADLRKKLTARIKATVLPKG